VLAHEPVAVRIVIAAVRGSAPREAGAGMLVLADQVLGTIGGGQLEWEALAAARLACAASAPIRRQRIVLGADRASVAAVWSSCGWSAIRVPISDCCGRRAPRRARAPCSWRVRCARRAPCAASSPPPVGAMTPINCCVCRGRSDAAHQ